MKRCGCLIGGIFWICGIVLIYGQIAVAFGIMFLIAGFVLMVLDAIATRSGEKSIDKSEEVWECEKCGAEIAETDKACPKCGVEFEGE